MEPLLHSEDVYQTEASADMFSSNQQQQQARFDTNQSGGDIDVSAFIATRVAEADSDDAAYPRDTLLHYGYEGEGSDVDDLSELGDSESDSDEEDDFAYLGDLGPEFDNLYRLYNPEDSDEDV